jgi:hypothetical protein
MAWGGTESGTLSGLREDEWGTLSAGSLQPEDESAHSSSPLFLREWRSQGGH